MDEMYDSTMRKVLITGGAGFLGYHLSKKHLLEGDEVVCLDNLHTGQLTNIEKLRDFGRVTFIEHDVTTPFDVDADLAYNFACPASPIHYQKDPIQTLKSNVIGAINFLDNAVRHNIPALQSSTSEIYGNPAVHPQGEEYWGNVNTIGLRSCYDEGKRVAETLFSDYRREFNLDTKIVRIFNTYGPNMRKDDGRVVSNFIMQALRNEDITMYGQGLQTRSFCYVDDLIIGIRKVMNSPSEDAGPYNIGNPCETTMIELANVIIKLTNSESKIIFKELPSDDPDRRNPNISKMKTSFDWTPKIDLESGLLKTIEFFAREHL